MITIHFEGKNDSDEACGSWAWIQRTPDHRKVISNGVTKLTWREASAPIIRQAMIDAKVPFHIPHTSTWTEIPGGWMF